MDNASEELIMNKNAEICLVSPPTRAFSGTVPTSLLYLHAWLAINNFRKKKNS